MATIRTHFDTQMLFSMGVTRHDVSEKFFQEKLYKNFFLKWYKKYIWNIFDQQIMPSYWLLAKILGFQISYSTQYIGSDNIRN